MQKVTNLVLIMNLYLKKFSNFLNIFLNKIPTYIQSYTSIILTQKELFKT